MTDSASQRADPAGQQTDLAAKQVELISALTLGGPPPVGMDVDRLTIASRALLRKRADAVQYRWPLLVAGLGTQWPQIYMAQAAGRAFAGSLQDGWELATELNSRHELPGLARSELATVNIRWQFAADRPPRLRRFGLRRSRTGLLLNINRHVIRLGR